VNRRGFSMRHARLQLPALSHDIHFRPQLQGRQQTAPGRKHPGATGEAKEQPLRARHREVPADHRAYFL
jgi:hypothetical protein